MNDPGFPARSAADPHDSMPSDLTVRVYSPESPLRHPGSLLWQMFRDLGASRELAWRLFLRDTRAQYRNSMLGYFWVFIPPLLASLPFIYLDATGVVSFGETPIPYGAYAMVGTILWQMFVDALNSPLKAVNAARTMLTRINFPSEALLLSGLMQVGFGILVRLVLLAGVFIWFGIVPPTTALLFPVGAASLILTGFVAGLLVTPLGLLFGDVQRAVPIATSFLMFLTPVIYPVPQTGIAAVVAALNPLTPLVVTTRDWLAVGAVPSAAGLVVVSVLAAVVLMFAWIAFRVALPHIIGRLGN